MARYDAITQAAIEVVAHWQFTGTRPSVRGQTLVEILEAKHPGAIDRAASRLRIAAREKRFKGNPPLWAKRYLDKYAPSVDELRWRRSRTKTLPSGRCYGGYEIVVTAGMGEAGDYEKTVLLHEIAHSLRPSDGHGDRFYTEYYRLVKAEGLYREALQQPYRDTRGLRAAARRARVTAKA